MKKIIFTGLLGIGMVFSAQAQALKVDAGGNVGVGTGTPGAKMHILDGVSNLYVRQANVNVGTFGSVTDVTTGLSGSVRVGAISTANNSFGGAVFQAWSDAAHASLAGQFYFEAGNSPVAALFFRTSLQTRMVIKKDGKVGIGNSAPTEALDVTGNIKYSGTIMSSDRRLKSNVSDFSGGLKEVLQLNPVSFNYNGKGGTIDGDHHIGLIAQELQEVAPEFVVDFTHKTMQEATLTEGPKEINSEDFLAIKDNEIKYLLVNAIKDQQKIIEDLESKLYELESKVTDIVNQYDVSFGSEVLSDAGEVGQNIPNPFRTETHIAYTIPEKATSASMNIVDMNGRVLKTIAISHTGKGRLNVNAENLPAGTYSYQLVVDNKIMGAKKMIRTK